MELSGIDEARDEAAVCLAEMAKFVLPGSMRRELAIEVRDSAPVLRTSLVFEAEQLRPPVGPEARKRPLTVRLEELP